MLATRRQRTPLEKINASKISQKEQRKLKILKLFDAHKQVSQSDIKAALDVSAKTVRNYLDELETAGEIEQHGKTGRGVYYTKKR